jgi:hypothetical protein
MRVLAHESPACAFPLVQCAHVFYAREPAARATHRMSMASKLC